MLGSFDQNSVGFQLWINLDAENKFCEPGYQEHLQKDIPVYDSDTGLRAKVISREVLGVKDPIIVLTPTYFLDFIVREAEVKYEHVILADWNSLIVCYAGGIKI